jgi:hypothetical protein
MESPSEAVVASLLPFLPELYCSMGYEGEMSQPFWRLIKECESKSVESRRQNSRTPRVMKSTSLILIVHIQIIWVISIFLLINELRYEK